MRFIRGAVAIVLLVASTTAARAAVVISGESMFFIGSGSYTLNLFATADRGAGTVSFRGDCDARCDRRCFQAPS